MKKNNKYKNLVKEFSTPSKKIKSENDNVEIKVKTNSNNHKKFIIALLIIFVISNLIWTVLYFQNMNKNIMNVVIDEAEVLALDESNKKTVGELKEKLIDEIGLSSEEIIQIENKYNIDQQLELISELNYLYKSEFTRATEVIEQIKKDCDILQVQCSFEGTLKNQISKNQIIINDEEIKRVEKVKADEEAKKNQAQIDNDSSNPEVKPGEVIEKCYETYDEAYQVALDRFLNDSNIEKISVDKYNCPRLINSAGNIVD